MMPFAAPYPSTVASGAPHGAMHAAAAGDAVRVGAMLRPTWGVVRVWSEPFGATEEFTIAEARGLCARIDAGMPRAGEGDRTVGIWIDHGGLKCALVAPREWFIAFLAAVRRELRKWDAAAQAAIAMQVDC